MHDSSPIPALSSRTTLRLGGAPESWHTVRSLPQLDAALLRAAGPVLVLGGGSNIVCSDEPFPGAVIEVALSGLHIRTAPSSDTEPKCFTEPNLQVKATSLPAHIGPETTDVWLHVAAGERWDDVVGLACRFGLGGIECLSGIPGNAGTTPIQNVGAYGQEIGDTLWSVTCMHRATRRLVSFSAAECELSYRNSRFKTRDLDVYVVVEVVFKLTRGARGTIRYGELTRLFPPDAAPSLMQVREAVLKTRASKSMLLDATDPNGRNCGSFFLNPIVARSALTHVQSLSADPVPHFEVDADRVKIPAAWLIEHSGFAKGHRSGNVGLSTKHTLCLVAHDNATASELLGFARAIRDGVCAKFGVELLPEPVLVGLSW